MNKVAIFDMDGVISDTLFLHAQAESSALAKYRIKMAPEEIIKEFNAVPDKVMFQKIFTKHNKKVDLKEIENEKWQMFKKLAKAEGINIIPGSLEFIDLLLDNNFTLGLASSSPQKIIDLILDTLNIRNKFKAVICTDEVEKGKPAPDIFLLAAKKIGTDPKSCIVFEDAPRGVLAAKAAGMRCIAITTTHTREELVKADFIVDGFEDIKVKELVNGNQT